MNFSSSQFPSHCGSRIFHGFFSPPNNYKELYFSKHLHKTAFALFVNDHTQRANYEALKKRFKILYQSPVLVNPNTENEYIIVIYLNEKPKKGN